MMEKLKMKVLFIVNGYPTVKMPEFCVFNKEQIEAVLGSNQISGELIFINAQEGGKIEYIKSLPRIRRAAKNSDVVHCFHGLSFIVAALGVSGKPIVVSFLNAIEYEYRESPRISVLLEPLTYLLLRIRRAFLIFKDKIPLDLSDRSFLLPNGVSTSHFRILDRSSAKSTLGLEPRKKYVLFVSSKNKNRKQKRYDRFHEVVSALKENDPLIEELVLVGQPRHLVPLYFNAASLHVISSDFEGSPNSVKEALACGTPVVSTNVGNVRDMITGTPGCYVAKDFEVATLARDSWAALETDLDREAIRSSIFARKLDVDASTEKLIEIYEMTLQRYEQKI